MEGTKQSNIAKRETTLYTKKHILYSYIPSAACINKKGLGICLKWSPLPLPLPPKRKKKPKKTKIDPQFKLFFLKGICFFMQWILFQYHALIMILIFSWWMFYNVKFIWESISCQSKVYAYIWTFLRIFFNSVLWYIKPDAPGSKNFPWIELN